MRRIITRLVLTGLAVAVTACASVQQRPPEQVVRDRAQARWDALVKGDTKTAYEYLSPGYRSFTTLEQYGKSVNKNFWKSVVVHDVVCAADSCEVHGTMDYEVFGKRTTSPYKEKWIREGSNWWFVAG